MSFPRHIAIVGLTRDISMRSLLQVTAALQKQVLRDFQPIWGVHATVDAFTDLHSVPNDYFPVAVFGDIDELTEETPIATAYHLITQQLGGWPTYLVTNVTGHNLHERQSEGRGKGKRNGLGNGVNHFNPASPLFEAKDAKLIALSDVGLLIATSIG